MDTVIGIGISICQEHRLVALGVDLDSGMRRTKYELRSDDCIEAWALQERVAS